MITWILVITLGANFWFYIPGYASKEACMEAKATYKAVDYLTTGVSCIPGPQK